MLWSRAVLMIHVNSYNVIGKTYEGFGSEGLACRIVMIITRVVIIEMFWVQVRYDG